MDSVISAGNYTVRCLKLENNTGITQSSLELSKEGCPEKRGVVHVQYIGWPDHGAPSQEGMQYIDQILLAIHNTLISNPTGKIITHCRYIYIYI